MQQIVFSKNNLFFYFLIFGLVFGVLLYDFIGFMYTDELMTLFLALFAGVMMWERKNTQDFHLLLGMGAVFLFYTIYSFAIHSNVPQAILMDLAIQIKPFLGFYCVYLLAPILTQKQKSILAIICLIVGGLVIIIGLTGLTYTVFTHPSRLATAITATALLFLYCSSYSWSDVVVFILLLSIGFFSTRSKFYGFWGVAVFLIVYSKAGGIIKFNFKSVLVFSFITILAVWLAWEKIVIYYVDGMVTSNEMWSRPAMMVTSVDILLDYFPFGSGLASFGTFASSEYYSPTYAEFGIDHIWGLSKEMPSFISDAFYPELAQFGVAGVALYFGFWMWMLKKATQQNLIIPKKSLIIWLIFFFFLIEGTADATFTHNRGLFILIIAAMSLKEKSIENQEDIPNC